MPKEKDPAPVKGMHLDRTVENVAEIEALAALVETHGGERIGATGLVDHLPRRARRTFAPLPALLGRKVHRALTWDAADRRDPGWWPQGISTSVRTEVRRDVLVISWYHKGHHGSRVSFLDLRTRRYEHVLLATPVRTQDGGITLEPLRIHAGGVVWHGSYLHIAGTGRGFFTCRTDDLMRVPDGSPLALHGHRYVLPLRFAYKAATDKGLERLRYSFLSLDRSTDPPWLVAGEYGSARQTKRIARFPTDPETGLLATDEDGFARPYLDERGVVRMQGVVVADGTYYVTTSQGHWTPGTVYVGRPGAFRPYRWATPMGPEDLVWWPATDLLWSVSEHPRRRWIYAMKRSRLRGPA